MRASLGGKTGLSPNLDVGRGTVPDCFRKFCGTPAKLDMGVRLEEIERQALALVAKKRVQLAEALLVSLHVSVSDVEATWAREIEDGVAAFNGGEMPAFPAEEVIAEARRLSD